MAFTVRLQKLAETHQKLVVKFVGINDAVAADEANVLKLDASTTTSSVTCLATRTVASSTFANRSMKISKIYANVTGFGLSTTGQKVHLLWAGATTTDTTGIIATFGAGQTFMDFNSEFASPVPDNSVTSRPGLLVTTSGMGPYCGYTMIVELKKYGFSVTSNGYVAPGGGAPGGGDFGENPVGGEF